MSFKQSSRRAFLQAAGIPIVGRLSGLPLLASPRSPSLNSGAESPAEGDDSLPIEVRNGASPSVRVKEAALFAFDDHSIPFTSGLRLHLIPGKKPGQHNPIVLPTGKPGEPDDVKVRYYGTIIQVGDELRMWYMGRGDKLKLKRGYFVQMYAVSKDGIHWERPKLGLINYNGSKQNNIVDLMKGEWGISESVVLYEPEDPDPSRRFKMAVETGKYQNHLSVAYSSDGLRWTESPRNPVGPTLEESGLIKYNGCYYVNGQGGRHYGAGRMMVTFASHDFEHWTQASALSFRRGPITEAEPDRWNNIEEVHLGASLINRGNVVLGIYGMWHGTPTSDRGLVPMDLGFIVSNDALHFREPIPDFRFLPAYEEIDGVQAAPSVAQGQGMVNLGDKTLYWYEAWGVGQVRLATWERDRLGYYSPYASNRPADGAAVSAVTCPMKLARNGGRVFINASGLSENGELRVEVLDREFQPLPGYSAKDCSPIQQSGFRQAATWQGRETLEAFPHPVQMRVVFGGLRPEDIKLYAIYVTCN